MEAKQTQLTDKAQILNTLGNNITVYLVTHQICHHFAVFKQNG